MAQSNGRRGTWLSPTWGWGGGKWGLTRAGSSSALWEKGAWPSPILPRERDVAWPHSGVGVGGGGVTWPQPAARDSGFENLAVGECDCIDCHHFPCCQMSWSMGNPVGCMCMPHLTHGPGVEYLCHRSNYRVQVYTCNTCNSCSAYLNSKGVHCLAS